MSCCHRQPTRLLVCRLTTESTSDPPYTQLNCQEMACPVLHSFWHTTTGLTQSPVLTCTSLHMSLLLVAYLGLTPCPMVSHARLLVCLVAVWRCAWLVNTQIQFTQIHQLMRSPALNTTGQFIGVFDPWGIRGIWNMGHWAASVHPHWRHQPKILFLLMVEMLREDSQLPLQS